MLRFRVSSWACLVVLRPVFTAAGRPRRRRWPGRPGRRVRSIPISFLRRPCRNRAARRTRPLSSRRRYRHRRRSARCVAVNLDFTYTFPNRPWNLYVGGGPAINWYNFDGRFDTEAGFNFLVGAKNRDGLFFEMKVGAWTAPT